MKQTIAACLLLAALFSPATPWAAWAEDGREGDLTEEGLFFLKVPVVTAPSRMEQPATEAPASVTIITAADIRTYGYRTLADILNSVRGLFITYDRNYQYAGVRGFNRPGDYNSRILLLVDGYRVNDAIYDTASIGQEFFLDVDLIDRVEVVRGPGSSVYGSNAFFGVVNVITRRGGDVDGLEASGEAASFGTRKERIAYGKRSPGGLDMLLSATNFDSRGQDLYFPEFAAPATNNGVARDLDYERANRVFGRLAFGSWTMTGAYSERVKAIPTASFGSQFNAAGTWTKDSQALADLAYYRALGPQTHVSGSLFYGGYFYDATFPYDQPPLTDNKDKAWGEWWGIDAKLDARLDKHKLVAGGMHQDNFRQDQKNYDIAPAAVYLDSRESSRREALYVQDEISLRQGLLLNAGVRYDHYSTVGTAYNPRAALICSPGEATTVKLLYGTAFRAPNAFELFYSTIGLDSKANPDLKPEEITTYEVTAEHRLRSDLRLTASLYRNSIDNLINQVVDPVDGLLVFRNIGQVDAKGAEAELERAWSDAMRLRASYARQVARDRATGEELTNSPRHLAKLNCSMPLAGSALRAGAELQYTSSRRTLGGGRAGGYAVANLTMLSAALAKGLELSASAYNLFDKRYADPGRPEHVQDVIQQDGRSYRVKATYLF